MKLISIVSPVFNEQDNIKVFCERVNNTLLSLQNYSYELILVNDGSTDSSEIVIRSIINDIPQLKLINLSRNFGHQAAITAGIYEAKGDAVIILDSDLQDPPELIKNMVLKWEGGFEVINAKRISRQDGLVKDVLSSLFYKLLNILVNYKIPENVGDYRLLDRKVVKVLLTLKEKDRYLRGLANWVGFKQSFVDFQRARRINGRTHYTWNRMFSLAFDAIFSFSKLPMKLAMFACMIFLLITFVVSIYTIYEWLIGNIIPGWTSIVLVISTLTSLQMFVLAVISEYVGRIYTQTQDRPLYIIAEKVNF